MSDWTDDLIPGPRPKKNRGSPPDPRSLELEKLPVGGTILFPDSSAVALGRLIHPPSSRLKRRHPDRRFRIMTEGEGARVFRAK